MPARAPRTGVARDCAREHSRIEYTVENAPDYAIRRSNVRPGRSHRDPLKRNAAVPTVGQPTTVRRIGSVSGESASFISGRLLWLDIVRVLCALEILGIHWLRACYKVGLFGANDPVSLVINYQGHNDVARMLPHVLIAGTGLTAAALSTDVVGLLGGFGWEGVSALVIVSGFSLTIAMKGRSLTYLGWRNWLKKRIVRIVVPFYLIAVPFLASYVVLFALSGHIQGRFAAAIHHKLLTTLDTPPLGIFLSHTLLLDPFSRQWQAQFFAPAWWFIPAIILAYLAFPLILRLSRRIGPAPLLIGAGVVSMVSYHLANIGVFVNESSYYIVMQECFNFALGIVVGELWQRTTSRPRLERLLFARSTLLAALFLFVMGNIANWSQPGRLFASMLYGPGLALLLGGLAKRIEGWRAMRIVRKIDAYDLYLVHQPFAFPLALAAKLVVPTYAVFCGWFLFLFVAATAAAALARAERFVFRRLDKARVLRT
jgi:hypothetical protein